MNRIGLKTITLLAACTIAGSAYATTNITTGTEKIGVAGAHSGDLASLARATRKMLDEAGRTQTQVFASGDLDEHLIARLREDGAPIDAFGVGTRLATSADAPFVEGIYKLVEIEEADRVIPKFKSSPGKETYPGKKQVLRTILDGDD